MSRKAPSLPNFHFLPNQTGNTRRTTDRENGPFCFMIFDLPADRKKQTKFLQKGAENEFDNGYSEKIYEVTGQEEKSHPMSQLMEKQSMRSTDNSPRKFWCTNSQRDATGREEEIKNKLSEEDGDIYNEDFDGEYISDRGSCSCVACSLRRILNPGKKPYGDSDETEANHFIQSSLMKDHRQLGEQSSYQKIVPRTRSNADSSVQAPIDKEKNMLQKPMRETFLEAASKEESNTLPNVSDSLSSIIHDVAGEKISWNIPSNVTKEKVHAIQTETRKTPKKVVAETSDEENKDRKGCKPDFSSVENQDTCSEKDKPIRTQVTPDKEIADDKPLTEHKPPNQDSPIDTKSRMIQLDADTEKYCSLEEDGGRPDFELSLDSEMFDMTEDDEYLYDDYDSEHYTLDNLMLQNSSATKSVFGSGGSVDKGGRYSKGISQFVNMPTFMQSIRKFACDNLFELRDVAPDGNCMFRAIADQLHINGDLGYNCKILRRQAVRYLRHNPCQSDGSRLEDFLSTESWEHYLQRMEQNYQWGDHMVLKAIADSLNLVVVVFNVYEDDIRRTEILSEGRPITKRQKLTIFLGHIGEFHYLSLRPIDWEKEWPYKSLIRRMQVNCQTEDKDELMGWIEQKIGRRATETFTEDLSLDDKSAKNTNHALVPDSKSIFLKYGLQHQRLQLEDKDESLRTLVSDPLSTDVVTGLTLPHFTYIINDFIGCIPLIMSSCMVKDIERPSYGGDRRTVVDNEQYGAAADGTNVFMVDRSPGRKMQFYEDRKLTNYPIYIVIGTDLKICFPNTVKNASVCAAESDTHAGYCRLEPVLDREMLWTTRLVCLNGKSYLKAVEVPVSFQNKANDRAVSKYYWGYKCPSFPPSVRKAWQSLECAKDWPPTEIRRKVLASECLIIQKAHPSSRIPEVEWKFVFSKGEKLLLKQGLTKVQMDIFCIFKIVVEHMTRLAPRPLKYKHFKNIFFYACEEIKYESWEDNSGGCLIYLFARLLKCLRKRCLPHYFIAKNNLLDYYSDEEVQTLCIHIEALRVFPIQCIQHLFDAYGWGKTFTHQFLVLNDCEHYARTNDIDHTWVNVFIPATLRFILPLTKFKLFEETYMYLKNAYENVLLAPLTTDPPSFQDIFLEALNMVEDVTSKNALAELYDKDCGTNILSQLKSDVVLVRDVLMGDVDEQIGGMEIPKSIKQSQLAIAIWLDNKALSYFLRMEHVMAKKLVLAAIDCAKRLLKGQNEFEIGDIEDKHLKEEIYRQKLVQADSVVQQLNLFYDHLCKVCFTTKDLHILNEHLKDLETFRHFVPGISDVIENIRYYQRERRSFSMFQ